MPHVPPHVPPDVSPDTSPDTPTNEPPGEPEQPEQPERETGAEGGLPDGQPMLAIADVAAGESDRELVFVVRLNRATGVALTVQYATGGGTATPGSDYGTETGSLTFAAHSTEARMVRVSIRDDAVDEQNETLLLQVRSPPGATPPFSSEATGTIIDNDSRSLIVRPGQLTVVEGQTARYAVVLGSRPTGEVTVAPAAPAEITVEPGELRFAPSSWATAQTVSVTAAQDDDALADPVADMAHNARGGGYGDDTAVTVQVTIVEDDAPTLSVGAARAREGAGSVTFEVLLSLATDEQVSVDYETGAAGDTAGEGTDYLGGSGVLVFPAGAAATREIEVVLHDDALDEDDKQFTLTLTNPVNATLAGGGDTVTATATIEDDDQAPELTITGASVAESAGTIAFPVLLNRASGRTVTVRYATADATAGASDYTTVSGTLTFEPGDLTKTISVPVSDDAVDEEDETFSVTLTLAVHATLAAGGSRASGTIRDDDEAPRLAIADASLTRGAETRQMHFPVTLDGPSGRTVTVDYATADLTAVAGTDYTSATGTLTLEAGTPRRTIAVAILPREVDEGGETFTVTLSNPDGAALSDAIATGTISGSPNPGTPDDIDVQPLTLAALRVTGAGTVYPPFAADVQHYAVTCVDSTTVQVAAQAHRIGATLKLLRANSDDDHESTGSLSAELTVDGYHDIVIELSDTDGTVTYVVHCIPYYFPEIKVVKKTAGAADGLLFVTPQVFLDRSEPAYRLLAIIDYNGVPRFASTHASANQNFRRIANGPLINGSQVRYAHGSGVLLDESFSEIRSVSPPSLQQPEFLVTEDGTFLFIVYRTANRTIPGVGSRTVRDSVILEVDSAGNKVFEWNSWNHLKLSDCGLTNAGEGYAHLNSVFLVEGDVVASFKRCNQVLRIDRSSGTGVVEWQIGGTAPPRSTATRFLEIVDDDEVTTNDEICGQHQATITDSGSVLLFDNGTGCTGQRKSVAPFTRVVEFDISSGTQASRMREYHLPDGKGYAAFWGGVSEIANGNWLINWDWDDTVGLDELISISEVDPDADPPTSVFEMIMSRGSNFVATLRVYHEAEEDVPIPLNLP